MEIFKTNTCPHCPGAVALAKELEGGYRGDVEVEIIDAMQQPQRAISYGIMAVPTIVINGTRAFVGTPSRDAFKKAIDNALGK